MMRYSITTILHRSWFIRKILGKKHRRLMSRASLVVAGESLHRRVCDCLGLSKRVVVIPTAIDLARYSIDSDTRTAVDDQAIGIVWIGQRSNR